MRLTCGAESRDVAVRANGKGVEVIMGDRRFLVEIEEAGPGVYTLRDAEGRAQTFHCVRDGETIHLFWQGVVYRLTEEKDGGRAVARQAAGALEAPMPGKVIAVLVQPGATVERGAPLVIMEAMKMEHTITAPAAGTVMEILYGIGEQVAEGADLIRFDAA